MVTSRLRQLRPLVAQRGRLWLALHLAAVQAGKLGRRLARSSARAEFRLAQRFLPDAQKRILAANQALLAALGGQRVFVLATGPSAADLDLSRLRGQRVIVANESYRLLRKSGVRPFAAMFIDVAYASGAQRYDAFLKDLADYARGEGVALMLNLADKAALDACGVFAGLEIYWLDFAGDLLDLSDSPAAEAFDLTRTLPGLFTVSHAAAAVALGAGAREVYLIGVDLDFIAAPDQPIRHAYGPNLYDDLDSHSAAAAYERSLKLDYPELLAFTARQQQCFKRLGQIAERRGQILANATPGGLLEAVPRVAFDSVVEHRDG